MAGIEERGYAEIRNLEHTVVIQEHIQLLHVVVKHHSIVAML
jgi:hypothetical protein